MTTARLVKDTLSKYVRFLIAVMGQGLGIASWPRSPAVTRTLSAYTEACGISSGSPGQFPGPMVSFPLKAPAPELRRRDYRPPQVRLRAIWGPPPGVARAARTRTCRTNSHCLSCGGRRAAPALASCHEAVASGALGQGLAAAGPAGHLLRPRPPSADPGTAGLVPLRARGP